MSLDLVLDYGLV